MSRERVVDNQAFRSILMFFRLLCALSIAAQVSKNFQKTFWAGRWMKSYILILFVVGWMSPPGNSSSDPTAKYVNTHPRLGENEARSRRERSEKSARNLM